MSPSLPLDLVVGTRPNVVKLAAVLAPLEADRRVAARVIHTGQHTDDAMFAALWRDLGLRAPDVQLAATPGPGLREDVRARYGRLLDAGPPPRGVVVFGDVDSTLACAQAAHARGIAVAHVEAGLRSFDAAMVEERNRVATDALADLLLTSEPSGAANLLAEGAAPERIHFVGNVMIDTLLANLERARAAGTLAGLGLAGRRYAYVTLHRPANVDDPARLAAFVEALAACSRAVGLVFPVHPRTRQRLDRAGLWDRLTGLARLRWLPPQGYLANLALLDGAALVLTDSGGLQEETTALGVPCLTLRTTTERPITVERGTNRLLVDAPDGLADAVVAALAEVATERAAPPRLPKWDGQAGARVAAVVVAAWRAQR